MTDHKPNQPAFPTVDYLEFEHDNSHSNGWCDHSVFKDHFGLNVREYFVGRAIVGILASDKQISPADAATKAYAVADAIIAYS